MNAEDLRQVCRDHSTMMLYAWVMECRTRFLAAAALLEWQTPEIVALAGVGKKVRVDTWPLVAMCAWSAACPAAAARRPRNRCTSTARR